MSISIQINGESQIFDQELTVHAMLEHLGVPRDKIAVERNLEIVPRSLFDQTWLRHGDRLEIIHFIGGG